MRHSERSDAGSSTDRPVQRYHVVHFAELGEAVEFCDRIVPHVAPRAGGAPHEGGRAAVWLHVPPRSQRSTHAGCYLLLSPGALVAAERAGMVDRAELVGELSRRALPDDAVLVLGDDVVEPRVSRPRVVAVERVDRPPAATSFTPRSGSRSEAAAG